MSRYRYYGSGMHMSADLKRVVARVRASRPEMFNQVKITETHMDGTGKVTEKIRVEVCAHAPSPRERHALAMEKY